MLLRIKNFEVKNYLYIFTIILLAIFCFINITSTPLRSGNTWDDANAMLRIGQLWSQGYIPFKDVFEQRGPSMYILYLIANMISKGGYIGLFIVEIVNLLVIQFLLKKIFDIQLVNKKTSLSILGALLVPMWMVSNFTFKNGGSPEEFSIPWILISIYMIQSFFKNQKYSHFFLVGVSFAWVFNMKYSLIGPWIALAIIILFKIFVSQDLKRACKTIGKILIWSVLGTLTVFLPMLGYFAYVGGIKKYFEVYFVTNLTSYTKETLPIFSHFL
ncbi:glycosyltransferase family 39 protein [Pediococcus stilesii]|uniref:Uncharacterized protein n=1 Tax=Pediococcus stilesii TaxID=331679 RepID=A0A0R2KVV6_9LACO|nr:glycosyltransferase family 39 protein [Pediococcus stilesii]KRN93711.1 hypothetical protein IV81_GL000288 [Pediococcus stilesii]